MPNERVGYEYLTSGEGNVSSLASLSFQDLNPLYNNTTQVPYSFYDQNAISLANDTPINGLNSFIEPSYDYHVIQNQVRPQP
ncbi:7734_t:CDS:2, partial [Gigaspora rosea]